MATTVELENLVVRLSADVQGLLQGMQQANAAMEAARKKTVSLGESFQALAVVAATFGAKKFLTSSLHEWENAETTLIKLEATLRANGREVDTLSQRYQAFATEMQNLSVIGDETILNLTKQAESFGITGREAERAAQDAMALGSIRGGSPEAFMRISAAMAAGDTDSAMMFKRMVPELRKARTEMEFIEKYNKMVAAGMEVMGKEAETAGGRLKQFNNTWGDFKEQLGKIVAEYLAPVAQKIGDVAKDFNQLSDSTKMWIVGIAAGITTLVLFANTIDKVKSVLTDLIGTTTKFATAAAANPYFWITAAVVGLVLLTRHLVQSTKAAEDLKKAQEDLSRHGTKLGEARQEHLQLLIERHRNNPEVLKRELEAREREADRLNKLSREFKEAGDKASGRDASTNSRALFNRMGRAVFNIFGHEKGSGDYLLAEDVAGQARDAQAEADKIRAAMKGKMFHEKEEAKRTIEDLQHQVKLMKMDAWEAHRAQAEFTGVNSFDAGKIADQKMQLEQATKWKSSKDELDSYLESLKELQWAVGKTEDEAKLERLERSLQDGGPGIWAPAIRRSLDLAKEYANTLKEAREEHERIGSLWDKARSIWQETMDPVDKFNLEMADLHEMLAMKTINQEQFDKMEKKLREQILKNEAPAAARAAAGTNTAEGFSRIFEYSLGVGSGANIPPHEDKKIGLLKDIRDLLKGQANRPTMEVLPANLDEVT